MGTVKRAYGREDKEARREVILAAATELFEQGQGELPSVVEIATAAGLAKGTVYLYFRTKETIFATLLLNGWRKVFDLLEQTLSPDTTDKQDTVEAFLHAYVEYLNNHRELLMLDALRSMVEHNLKEEIRIDLKQTFDGWLNNSGALIDREIGLSPGRGLKILTRTYALTVGLWKAFGSGRSVEVSAKTSAFYPDFIEELSEALVEYWRGALGSSR